MALSNNPNLSRGIEKQWRREINRRWAAFSKRVNILLAGLQSDLITNLSSEESFEVDQFQVALEASIITLLLGDWQNKYQTAVYERTLDRANARYKKEAEAIARDTVIFVLLFGLFESPAGVNATHRNELDFLYKRANDKLLSTTSTMAGEIRQIMQDNYNVDTFAELTKKIQERIKVSKTSAERIARTEITQAAQRASINQADEIELIVGSEVKLRWITVDDGKVRHLHATWHGKLMTKKQARKNANISPWNCRCGLQVVPPGSDTKEKQNLFDRERSFLLAKEKALSNK